MPRNSAIARQKLALEAGNHQDFVVSDQGFHRQMYEAAGVLDLWAVVGSVVN